MDQMMIKTGEIHLEQGPSLLTNIIIVALRLFYAKKPEGLSTPHNRKLFFCFKHPYDSCPNYI